MENKQPEKSKRSASYMRLLAIGLALGLFGLVVLFLAEAEDNIDVSQIEDKPSPLLVTVETIKAGPQSVFVSAFANVTPRYQADISAAISGRIIEVTKDALAGRPVKKGTVLARIETTRFEADLAAAKLALKEAELALWQAVFSTRQPGFIKSILIANRMRTRAFFQVIFSPSA